MILLITGSTLLEDPVQAEPLPEQTTTPQDDPESVPLNLRLNKRPHGKTSQNPRRRTSA